MILCVWEVSELSAEGATLCRWLAGDPWHCWQVADPGGDGHLSAPCIGMTMGHPHVLSRAALEVLAPFP